MTDMQQRARGMADTIMGMFWYNYLKSEPAFIMRDLIAIEIEKAEQRGRDVGRAIGWDAAKRDTSAMLEKITA